MNPGDLDTYVTFKKDMGTLKATGQEPDWQVDTSIGNSGSLWVALVPIGVAMVAQRENTGLRYDRVTTKATHRMQMYGPIGVDFGSHQIYDDDNGRVFQPIEEEYSPGAKRDGISSLLVRDITHGL